MARKTNVDTAAAFFEDQTEARDVVQKEQQVQGVQVKGKHSNRRPTIEEQSGRKTTHAHAILFVEDLDVIKEMAYRQRISASALIRNILTEYADKHRGEI